MTDARTSTHPTGEGHANRIRQWSWWRRVAPYIGVVVGLAVLASPVIADFIESFRADRTISQVTTTVQHIDPDTKAELLSQAHAYNEELATHVSSADVWPYEQQLAIDTSSIMCWVEIPRIDIRLEVHHGTNDSVLAAGAGHLEGTSLPVGGASSRCALSAHSGMPTARMFDDIHDLVPGDIFILWTLDEPYAYRVFDSEVVEPDAVAKLDIEEGKDLCTLITCTPYGINSHRLLVHGQRCPYDETRDEPTPPMYVSPRVWPLVAGLVLAGSALVWASFSVILARRRRRNDE